MKTKIVTIGIAMLIIMGCNKFKKGEGSMLYKFMEDKSGDTIKVGDFTALTYTVKTEEGHLLYNSDDEDGRFSFKFRETPRFKGDFFTALGLLSEGDQAVFKLDKDSTNTETAFTKSVDTRGRYLIYTIRVDKVIHRGTLNDSSYNSKIEAFKAAEAEKARQGEVLKINRYLTLKNLNPVVTASGLNYVITKAGTGSKPLPTDSVELQYTAMFLSGKILETSYAEAAKKAGIFNKLQSYGSRRLQVTAGKPFSGFNEALTLFSKGTKVTLIIPSKLAYGSDVYKNAQPYTPLQCELEIINIIHPRARSLTRQKVKYPQPEIQ